MNKKNMIQLSLIIIITAAFIFYIKNNLQQIKDAIAIRPSFLIILILLNIANKIFMGLKTKKILEVLNIKLPFKEWFGMSVVNNFYNYLAPKSGTAAIGIYLKSRYRLDYHKYLGVLITTALITILTSGIVGFIFSLYSCLPRISSTAVFLIMFTGMILGPMVLFIMPRLRLPEKGFFEKVNEFFEGWDILRKDIKTILIVAVMDMLIISSIALRYMILFRIFSVQASFASCVLIAPFNIITHFAAIVPGAYGIKEAVVGAVSMLTNISFASGALATLSDRIIMMAISFVLGPIFSFILLRHNTGVEKEGQHK